MKIVYCADRIEGVGGIEKVTILKANALANIAGNQVYILVTDNQKKTYIEPIDEKVNIIELGVNYHDNDWIPGFRSKVLTIKKKVKHAYRLKTEIDKINPDVVIGVGASEKFFLNKFRIKNKKTVIIREIHYPTRFREILATSKIKSLIGKIMNFFDFKLYSTYAYDAIICLTKEDLDENWKNNSLAYYMPNPIAYNFMPSDYDVNSKTIVAVGRLEKVKNFISLIRAFSSIGEVNKDWRLKIYGDGSQSDFLKNYVLENHLYGQIELMGSTTNVPGKLSDSSFFVMTSLMEGFPLSILEAMYCRLPVISYECKYGPTSIVTDGRDGFLVPVNDEDMLANKMQELINSTELRAEMSRNAFDRVADFSINKIAKDWMALFNVLINKKNQEN